MRPVFTLLVGPLLLAGACSRGRAYELHGQVLAVDPARQELTIKHGDIRGFMPGMTMPFKVRDAKLMEGRTPGDLVTATLVVEDNTAYLTTVLATGRAPLTEPPPPPRAMDILDPGSLVPDVTLIDETGANRSISDWRGRVLAVTFTYTRCPLPDFCPRVDQNFAVVQREVLKDPSLLDRVRLLSVSIDPQFDTSEVLAAHARRAGADARVWRFATGDPEAITQLAGRFGVSVFREGSDPAALTHNLRTAVVKPDGTLATVLGGNDWTPAALIEAARRAGG
jgi:protein SCO1/2